MKTSREWWLATKSSEAAMNDWLVRQVIGEREAAARIEQFILANEGLPATVVRAVRKIAADERRHASMVQKLLDTRGVSADENHSARYWPQVVSAATLGPKEACAVAAHAEKMRLERLRVIAADTDAPADVRSCFKSILADEEWHERVFRQAAGSDAMAATLSAHLNGTAAINLIPQDL